MSHAKREALQNRTVKNKSEYIYEKLYKKWLLKRGDHYFF